MKIHNARQPNHCDIGRLSWISCVVAGLLVMGSAHAQWQVVDKTGNKHLGEIKKQLGDKDGNVNGNLKNLYNQQEIGKYKSSGTQAKDPEEKLDVEKPSEVEMGVKQRCPPTKAEGVAQDQYKLCQEIVKTELAQYKYSLKMYETTKERDKRLKEIEKERQGIKATEQGKLQDNSNKLLALLSRMEIDRQQHKTYMDAYAARLQYLKMARDTLTQQALHGKTETESNPPVGQFVGAAAGGLVLAAALEAIKTERRYKRH